MKKIFVLLLSICFCLTLTSQVVVNISTYSNTTCFGNCDGSATASVTGGTPPYMYQWSNFSYIHVVTGVCPGTYTVTVTDQLGSTGTASVTINQPPQLQLIVNTTDACGAGCNGFATLSACCVGPYTYSWSNVSGPPFCPGNYSVTVTNTNGCTAAQNFTINSNPSAITDITFDSNPAFCGSPVGAAWITSVQGGTSPFLFHWSNGAIGQTITNLSAGTYVVTVTDSTGCGYYESITIQDSIGFTLSLDSISPANCANNQLGYMGISITGGQGPFGISWSNGETQTTYIDSLLQDIYEVTVFDSTSWCIQTLTDTVLSTYNLYASILSQPANCTPSGWASVHVQGVNPPFTYLWNDPLSQTDSVATGLAGGNYICTITDAIGCYITASAQISSNCFTIISGRVYNDLNQDCVQDSGEAGLQGIILQSNPAGSYAITDTNGDYTISTLQTSCSLHTNLSSYYQYICPASNNLAVTVPSLGDTSAGNNFAVYINSASYDLVIHPGWTTGHPGFQKRYWIYYGLNSGIGHDAIINFVYDPVLQFDNCTGGGIHDAPNHTITWNIPNVTWHPWAYSYVKPEIYFTVPVGTPITDSLETYFEILPLGDINPVNNIHYIIEPVTGSHDPNDKQVYPRGEGVNGCILPEDSVLLYTIRFQNDGNDTAFTVVVVDTLSPFVNPATFVAGAGSHPYTVSMTGEGILTFRFDHIMLPDSTVDHEGSQGSVNYTVHLDNGLPWNTVINNRAAIFFDFNEVVITNTVVNTLCEPLSISMDNNLIVSVYPNPAKNAAIFTVSGSGSAWTIRILDICGKEILAKNITGGSRYDMSIPENISGLYFYEVSSGGKTAFGKLIIE